MKNYFIIHALGNISDDHWYRFVKQNIEDKGYECITPTMPKIEKMSYSSWKEEFNKYKDIINEESVFIGHSTGAIFIIKYLMENNLKIDKYISVVGFNKTNTRSYNLLWDEINKSFFVDDLSLFKKYANEIISFYSPSDVYDFKLLDEFATELDAKKEIIENAGHFTKGYEKEFKEILKYL